LKRSDKRIELVASQYAWADPGVHSFGNERELIARSNGCRGFHPDPPFGASTVLFQVFSVVDFRA
jgi:hypothetical protein